MWQVTNQRKHRNRRRDRDKNRISLHIKRVEAMVSLLNASPEEPQRESHVRLILNDISESGMGFFSTQAFNSGAKISITILSPLTLTVKAIIHWCQHYDVNSHIISTQKFSYRIGVKFYHENEDDRTNAKIFFEELVNLSRSS